MPEYDELTGWKRRYGRAGEILAYLALVTAGVIGMTWPPDYALDGWAFIVTRISGGLAVVASIVAVYAQIRRRWLLELEVIAGVGLGLSGYMLVLLLYVGPAREWLLMSAFIAALLFGLAARSSVLAARVDRRVEDKRAARAARRGRHE